MVIHVRLSLLFLPLALAGVFGAQAYSDLQSAYAALGFDPSAPGNAVVVFFSDQHMCLFPQGLPANVVTTNIDSRLLTTVNSMVPPPTKIISSGDVSSSLSPAPGIDGLSSPFAFTHATNEMALFAAEIKKITNVAQSQIVWIPGNHDQSPSETNAETFCSMFPQMPTYQSFDIAGVKFLLLNSGNYGEPSESEERWLRQQVAHLSPTQEVAVFTHQPPFHGSVVHRGVARLLRDLFGDWQSRWWVFDGHEHWPSVEVYNVGQQNVAQITVGPASTNTFVGYSYGVGYMLLCLSNGIAGQIYYQYRSEDFEVVRSPDWTNPLPFIGPFEDTPGVLWRRLKTRSSSPEMIFPWALNSIDWWAYPVDLHWAIPLGQHANLATHFLLLVTGMTPTSIFEFSTNRANWLPLPIPLPTNSVYWFPIPGEMRSLPTIYGRFRSFDGNNWVAGWGLATTNEGPLVQYPQVQPIADQEVVAGRKLTLTVTAVDPYAPPDVLHYALAAGPASATLDEQTGVFSWRPALTHPPQNVSVKVKVSDGYSPPFSATRQFQINVVPATGPIDPSVQVVTRAPGGEIQITGQPGPVSSYQWFHDGLRMLDTVRITGSQTTTLTIKDCVPEDSGFYILTSVTGSIITNATYYLDTGEFGGATNVNEGNPLELSGGEGGFYYQWFKGNQRLEDDARLKGSQDYKLRIERAELADRGTYVLKCGSNWEFENARFEVQVIPPSAFPVILNSYLVSGTNSVTFKVEASGSPPLSYQWYWQGQVIPGATETSLTYDPADTQANAGYYSVAVSNAFGTNSSPAPGLLFFKATPAGSYRGLFYATSNPAPETSGAFQYTLSASKRSFSGKVLMGKSSSRFSGVFSQAQSAAVKALKAANGTPLTLSLQLLTTNDSPGVIGTLGNGSWTLPLRGHRVAYSSKNPAPQAGRYTLALLNQHTNFIRGAPDGCGVGSVVVSKNGSVALSGSAADGTAISQSSMLSQEGDWPLYISLYKNRGCLVGWLRLMNPTQTSITGQDVYWLKKEILRDHFYPKGFSNRLQAIGSTFNSVPNPGKWSPPAVDVLPFTEAVASLTGGDMFSPDSSSPDGMAVWAFVKVQVPAPNTLAAEPSAEKLKLRVSKTTGTISGTFINPTTRLRAPIEGKILQQQNRALGYFLSGNSSERFSGFFSLTTPGQGE